jgi:hypothetical protein
MQLLEVELQEQKMAFAHFFFGGFCKWVLTLGTRVLSSYLKTAQGETGLPTRSRGGGGDSPLLCTISLERVRKATENGDFIPLVPKTFLSRAVETEQEGFPSFPSKNYTINLSLF